MSKAKSGDTVKVHYTGKLEDGTVFDSSRDREPLEFQLGAQAVITGFDNGIKGMEVGESKSITIPPEDAYGDPRSELISTVDKKLFDQQNITPEVGKQLQIPQDDKKFLNVIITAVDEKSVTLDANHPLAGKTLVFDVELVEIA